MIKTANIKNNFRPENKRSIEMLNWLTVLLWGWYLLSAWSVIPVPAFLISNPVLAAFLIFSLQILGVIDWEQAWKLKDKDLNLLALITLVTTICLLLADSRFGAFFTVVDFCMLLYVCNKWRWNRAQVLVLGSVYVIIFFNWAIAPILADPNGNSNMAGTIMAFALFGIVALIERFWGQYKWKWLLEGIFLLLSFRQIAIFHGRSTFLALIIYCILRLPVANEFWKRKKLFYFICYVITLGSALFAICYTYVWRICGDLKQIEILGKSIFSGRERIWDEVWTLFLQSPLWGTGTNFELKSFYEFNIHNAMFDILVIHGIIVFVLVTLYIVKKLQKLYFDKIGDPVFIPAMAGVLAVFFESFTDMDLLWAPQLLVWSFTLVVLGSGKGRFNEKLNIGKY